MGKIRKKAGGDDHGGGGGHDAGGGMRWLLTYADMITLLLALFIFLYSVSEVNSSKVAAFTSSFAELFGIGRVPESAESQSGGSGLLPEANAIVQLQQQLEANLHDLIQQDMAEVEAEEQGLTLRLKDKVLFGIGQAEIASTAEPVLQKVGQLLNRLPNHIRVEGHTDNLPMTPGSKYPSNWELSGARAASVVRFLIDKCNINPARLSFAGFAEFHPRKPNFPFVGNAENRRVEIVVLKKTTPPLHYTDTTARSADILSLELQESAVDSSRPQHTSAYLETDL